MFIYGLLALVYFLAMPAAVIFLLMRVGDLKKRIDALEKRPEAAPAPRRSPWVGAAADAAEAGTPTEEAPRPDAEPAPPGPETPGAPAEAETPEAPERPEAEVPTPPEDAAARPPAVSRPAAYTPPAAFVLRREKMAALGGWLAENWFLAVAALSLGLAGVFFVQYGIETGLLTPPMRVAGALILGALLIGAAEWIRRRYGDEDGAPAAVLPSTFAGAGLVSIFAGVLAARQLYGLIGPEMALGGLVLTGALGVLLGWFYGPFLSGVGLIGATAAPFLVGGEAEEPYWLYGYFAVVVLTGLAIDAARRWAWLSVLSLVLGFGGAALVALASGGGIYHLGFALAALGGAAAVPVWQMAPATGGVTVSESLWLAVRRKPREWPEFPTRIAAGAMLAACAVALWVARDTADPAEIWAALGALGVLFAAGSVWLRRAPGLEDLPALPLLAFWAWLVQEALDRGPLYRAFTGWVPPEPETAPPDTVTWLVGGALLASVICGWRAARATRSASLWAAGAALAGPVTLIMLESLWNPLRIIGAYPWALHAMAAAAVMTLLAVRLARRPEAPSLGRAVLVMAALTMIALGAVVIFTKGALTLALALMVALAAALDRRFDLRELGLFGLAGTLTVGWRLLLDPGIFWAVERAGLVEVLFTYLGSIALLALAWAAVQGRGRWRQAVYLESAVLAGAGMLASVLLSRAMDATGGGETVHASLQGSIWLIVALVQLYRLRAGGRMNPLRVVLALLTGAFAVILYGLTLTFLHPVWGFGDAAHGPVLFNMLVPAYLLPALILLAGRRLLGHLPWLVRRGLLSLGLAGLAHYVALEIRHFWRGAFLDVPGVTDPELYTYTLALLLTSAGLMIAAWRRRSPLLRRAGVVLVGLTIAKVFLIDMSGLTGLIRVVSFLGLGLSLAGLALVNRWMTQAWAADTPPDPSPSERDA